MYKENIKYLTDYADHRRKIKKICENPRYLREKVIKVLADLRKLIRRVTLKYNESRVMKDWIVT